MLGSINKVQSLMNKEKNQRGDRNEKEMMNIVTTICLGILLVACGGESGDTDKVIKLGINGEVNQIWKSVQSR